MKPMLTALLLMFVTSTTFATENNHHSFAHSCNVELHGGIRIDKQSIAFLKKDKTLYKIINNRELLIQDQKVKLNNQQKNLVHDYALTIRKTVPKVKNIALDAIDLAMEGVTLAFNELLGENNQAVTQLTTELSKVRNEINQHFTEGKTIYFDENGLKDNEFLGNDFEQHIEELVEETVQSSIGSLLVTIGQEILTSDGDMNAFETKMDKFGERISHAMEIKTQTLATKTESLCQAVIHIDSLEEQLKNAVPLLHDVDVLSVTVEQSE